MGLGAVKEGQDLVQIVLDASDGVGCDGPPVGCPLAEAQDGLAAGVGLVDGLGLGQAGVLMLAWQLGSHVAHLVCPAPLPWYEGIDRLKGAVQTSTPISAHHLQPVSGESPPVETVQESRPRRLALRWGLAEVDHLTDAVVGDAISA